MVLLALGLFLWERDKERRKKFMEFCENIVGSGHELMRYAMINIPQAVMMINDEGIVEWFNEHTREYAEHEPEQGLHVNEFWNGILDEKILKFNSSEDSHLVNSGKYIAKTKKTFIGENGESVETVHYFQVFYHPIAAEAGNPKIMSIFAQEITFHENLKTEYQQSRTVIMYMQVDNFDEIMQGLNETEKSSLVLSINGEIETWINSLSGFMQRVSSYLFVVVLENLALQKAIEDKFTILDKIRQIISKNGIPVTLSIGIAVAEKNPVEQSMTELGKQAQER